MLRWMFNTFVSYHVMQQLFHIWFHLLCILPCILLLNKQFESWVRSHERKWLHIERRVMHISNLCTAFHYRDWWSCFSAWEVIIEHEPTNSIHQQISDKISETVWIFWGIWHTFITLLKQMQYFLITVIRGVCVHKHWLYAQIKLPT